MGIEFSPYPKSKQLKRRTTPTKKVRTKITDKEYNRMIDEFGEFCVMCGRTPIEAHHIVFRSHFGSGNWRNLAPLCDKCHKKAHRQREFADLIRDMRSERFGSNFWKDKYSLYKEGLIPDTEDETYESFMLEEEKRQ